MKQIDPYDNTERKFTSQYDIVQFTGRVHSTIRKVEGVSEDLVLARLSSQQRDYCVEQYTDANLVRSVISRLDDEVAKKTHAMLTDKPQFISIFHRNLEGNFLPDLFNRQKSETIQEEIIKKPDRPEREETSDVQV